jgi:polyisoprenoid-binding protein YceI
MAANQDGVIYVLSGCPVVVASCTYDIQSYHWFLLKHCKQLVMNFATVPGKYQTFQDKFQGAPKDSRLHRVNICCAPSNTLKNKNKKLTMQTEISMEST